MEKEGNMLKKTLFVLLSVMILSGVCFAQANPAKEQMKETTPAVTQEQPAKEQMKATTPAAAPEQPAKEQMKEAAPAVTQEQQPALVLEEIHICTGIEDRQPSGVGTVFSDDLGKIYCFTKIGGAEGTTDVYHVWYFGDKEIARVKLPVKLPSWRTWSSKTLNMGLGNGRVEVVTESGAILGKAEFEIQAAQKPEKVEKPEKTGVSEEEKMAPKEQKEAPKGQ
jgi:Protein of unknown function (DUF2914)